MKLQVTLIAVVFLYLATITTSISSQQAQPSGAFLSLEDVAAPVEHHQPETFLESDEGLVRNKRQFGYGGYGGRGGYGGGYRGGYGGGGFRGGYGGGRGYGGYGGRGGYGGGFGGGGFGGGYGR